MTALQVIYRLLSLVACFLSFAIFFAVLLAPNKAREEAPSEARCFAETDRMIRVPLPTASGERLLEWPEIEARIRILGCDTWLNAHREDVAIVLQQQRMRIGS